MVDSIKAKHHRWFGTAFWLNVRSSLSRVAREVKSTLVPITNGSIFLDAARICQGVLVKDLCREFVEIVDCMISCAMSLDCWIDWKRNLVICNNKIKNNFYVLHWLTWLGDQLLHIWQTTPLDQSGCGAKIWKYALRSEEGGSDIVRLTWKPPCYVVWVGEPD